MPAKDPMIVSTPASPASPGQAFARPVRFELPKARNFIEKSLPEDTRRAYTRALLDFFSFVRKPPAQVTVEDVIAYRDDLVKKKRRKARTVWSHGRWTARVKVKGGRERTIPFPKDVKQAIDHYLKLDAGRRRNLHSDGDDAFIFQPIVNYRTLEFARPLSARHIGQIVNRWAWFAGLNQSKQTLSPHDLRRTAVTRALSLGFTYRQVQSMTGHKDIRMVVRYDHERGNLEENAINFLHYDEKREKR